MDIKKKKIAAFDLDGTITQHRTPVSDEHIALLTKMAEKYKILMVGAGMCDRIFHQLREFPVDIIGCYGMQFCEYDNRTADDRRSGFLRMPVTVDSDDPGDSHVDRQPGFQRLPVADGIECDCRKPALYFQ